MMKRLFGSLFLVTFGIACQGQPGTQNGTSHAASASGPAKSDYASKMGTVVRPDGAMLATFAGGCFWCLEAPFDVLEGVLSTTSGYIDGKKDSPTYEEVSSGSTGYTEAIQIVYDPKVINYDKLIEVFWHNIDPTAENRQFCDSGTQYRTGIYVHDRHQRASAERTKAEVEAMPQFAGKVVTPIKGAPKFWPAENYHQDFYKKKPNHYKRYRIGCGRDARLKQLWGDAAGH